MDVLVTGASGFVGSALVGRLQSDGHRVRAFARSAERVRAAGAAPDAVVEGDAESGAGLAEALDGAAVAYYLIHAMQGAAASFAESERRQAERFAAAAAAAGTPRIVYLGGPAPAAGVPSRHLASRLAVEEALLAAVPGSIALRASVVIGARSRSFRFLVRLIERLPMLALPDWRRHRSAPVDGRDVLEYLAAAATLPAADAGRAYDVAGPEVVSYEQLIVRIAEAMMVFRPLVGVPRVTLTPLVAVVAAAVAGEDPGLVEPLMETLQHDLLPAEEDAAARFGVRLHGLDRAISHAVRELDEREGVMAR